MKLKSCSVFGVLLVGILDVNSLLFRQLHAGESGHLRFDPVPDCVGEGYFPNNEDCTKFYRCVNESRPDSNTVTVFKRYDYDCAPGTVYDPQAVICTFPAVNSTCEPESTTVQPIDEETDSEFNCPKSPDDTESPALKCVLPPCEEGSHNCKSEEHCCPYYNVGGLDCQYRCIKKKINV